MECPFGGGDKVVGAIPTGGYTCQAPRLVVEPEVGFLRSAIMVYSSQLGMDQVDKYEGSVSSFLITLNELKCTRVDYGFDNQQS